VWSDYYLQCTNGNGIFVIVGHSRTIITYSDEITCISRTSGTINNLYKVIQDKGIFVTIANSGILYVIVYSKNESFFYLYFQPKGDTSATLPILVKSIHLLI
jgi:hypothetical protein